MTEGGASAQVRLHACSCAVDEHCRCYCACENTDSPLPGCAWDNGAWWQAPLTIPKFFFLAAGASASAVAGLSLDNTMVACQQPVPLHDARFSDWHFSEGKGRVTLPCASLGRYRLPYKVLPSCYSVVAAQTYTLHVSGNCCGCFLLLAKQVAR